MRGDDTSCAGVSCPQPAERSVRLPLSNFRARRGSRAPRLRLEVCPQHAAYLDAGHAHQLVRDDSGQRVRYLIDFLEQPPAD